jgi:hypothetical protein
MTMQDQRSTFEWQGLTIEVLLSFPAYLQPYKSVYGYELAHFEVRSLCGEPLPISETGYRSVFTRPEDIAAEGGPVAYARALLDFEARSPLWLARQIAARQYSLFE